MTTTNNIILSLNLSSKGAPGQVLTTNGIDTLSWSNSGGGGGFTGTPGSIPFVGLGGSLTENNGQLFWDEFNNYLGLGTSTPSALLDVVGKLQIDSLGIVYTDPFIVESNASPVIGGTRGIGAVDLQLRKTDSSHVASGQYASLLAGFNNLNAGSYASVVGGRDGAIGCSSSNGQSVVVFFNDGLPNAVPPSHYIGTNQSDPNNPSNFIVISLYDSDVKHVLEPFPHNQYIVNSGTHYYFWLNVTDHYLQPASLTLPSPENAPFQFSPTGGGPRNVIGYEVAILTTDTNTQIRNKFAAVVNSTEVFVATPNVTNGGKVTVTNVKTGQARLAESPKGTAHISISFADSNNPYGSDATVNSSNSFIGAGERNVIFGPYGTITGGLQNAILPGSLYSTITGGQYNAIWGGNNATILGGYYNEIYNSYSVSLGSGAQDVNTNDFVIGNLSAQYDGFVNFNNGSSLVFNHFRVDGKTSDVHIGRAVNYPTLFTPPYTNKLFLHTLFNGYQSNAVTLRAPPTLTSMVDFTLPDNVGAAGQFLTTDGTGILSWAIPSGGGGGSLNNPVAINGVSYNYPYGLGGIGQFLITTDNFGTLDWAVYGMFDNPVAFNGVVYNFPVLGGTAGQVLLNDGINSLTWGDIPVAAYADTYTPTLSNTPTNQWTSLTTGIVMYEVIGSRVTVHGNFTATPTTGVLIFKMSLPINRASNFNFSNVTGGGAFVNTSGGQFAMAASSDALGAKPASNDTVYFIGYSFTAIAGFISVEFTYDLVL